MVRLAQRLDVERRPEPQVGARRVGISGLELSPLRAVRNDRVGVHVGERGDASQPVRGHDVVVVEESHPVPCRHLESAVPCGSSADAVGAKTHDPRIGERIEDRRGRIGRTVVDDDELPVGVGLAQHRFDRPAQ
ncbi:MAG: hypothetical protein RJB65_1420 [Actinomycetota bacterium]